MEQPKMNPKATVKEYKISFNKESLKVFLALEKHFKKAYKILPILENYKIQVEKNKVIILVSDIENSLFYTFEAKSDKTFSFLVDKDDFRKLKIKTDFSIEWNQKEKKYTFQYLKVNQKRKCFSNAEEYVKIPELKNLSKKTKTNNLPEKLKKLNYFVATDECRPVMTGVYFDTTNNAIVATDAHKLRYYDDNTIPKDFVLNRFSSLILIDIKPEHYQVSTKITKLKTEPIRDNDYSIWYAGNYTLISKSIEGEYPNWKRVMPTEFTANANINKKDLIFLIEQAAMSANAMSQIFFTFSMGKVEVKSGCLEFERDFLGEAKCDYVSLDGEELTVSFNSKHLLTILKLEDNVCMEFVGANKPCIINNYYLIMPICI